MADHAPIVIGGDQDFTVANGVTSGTGAADDPYVLEGWRIVVGEDATGIQISNTTASFIIRHVEVDPQTTPAAFYSRGVELRNVSSASIVESTLDDNGFGIFIFYSSHVRILNTTFRLAPREYLGGSGVVLEHTNDTLLSRIEMTGMRVDGVSAYSVSNLTLEESNFAGLPAAAVYAQDSTHLTFRGNTFLQDPEGISIGNGSDLVLESNVFDLNRYGIQLASARRVEIVGNDILRSDQAGMAIVEDSRFPNPTFQVLAYHNRFDGNSDHVQDWGRSSIVWDHGYPDGGNYWSGFVTPDRCRGLLQDNCTNRDGIVDIPYTGRNSPDFMGNVDRYPLVRPYTDSRSPPHAALSVLPTEGNSETNFEFDATKSSDTEDPLPFLEARWDFDGDFTFDTDWSSNLTMSYRYPRPGTYHPRVEVRDTTGASSVSTLTVVVSSVPINWIVPAGIVGATVTTAVAIGFVLWRWRRRGGAPPEPPLSESRP